MRLVRIVVAVCCALALGMLGMRIVAPAMLAPIVHRAAGHAPRVPTTLDSMLTQAAAPSVKHPAERGHVRARSAGRPHRR